MKTPRDDQPSLWDAITGAEDEARELSQRWLKDARNTIALSDLAHGSSLDVPRSRLAGRSVLIATQDQLASAAALIELDGVARRLVLCPPDVAAGHLPAVAATAEIEAIVSDREAIGFGEIGDRLFVRSSPHLSSTAPEQRREAHTEWILLTSGTTGVPKLVVHDLASLAGAIEFGTGALGNRAVWSTFYDIRRYGGLQIFLRAMLGGGSMVLSSAGEATGEFLTRAGICGVTHISGTPSHWRRALMSPAARRIAPHYARLSGEIADQSILDRLKAFYPQASVAHAFASTEAGVAFDVGDGLAGFPVSLVGRAGSPVELKVEDDSLRIRSGRNARRYLGAQQEGLVGSDGFVDTGDIVGLRGERYHFVGRRGGIINVGGLKVHPEEVEAVINRHPAVQASRVRSRRSPITGAIVVAEIVPREGADASGSLTREILDCCREALPAHKVPAAIRIVPSLEVTAAGKLDRANA